MSGKPRLVGNECRCGHGQGTHQPVACYVRSCACEAFDDAGPRVPAAPVGPLVTAAQVEAGEARGLSYPQLAAQLGVSTKTVWRARRRAKLIGSRVRPVTTEERARVKLLASERMPATWIAEDVGRGVSWVRAQVRGGPDSDWSSAWHQIRQNPTLLALHREFAPPRK